MTAGIDKLQSAGQAAIKVNEHTKERIRYLAALTDATQSKIVDRAVSEYAARHAEDITAGMQRARAVLASGVAPVQWRVYNLVTGQILR